MGYKTLTKYEKVSKCCHSQFAFSEIWEEYICLECGKICEVITVED